MDDALSFMNDATLQSGDSLNVVSNHDLCADTVITNAQSEAIELAIATSNKLAPKFSGPYEIKQIVSPVIVDLRSKRGKWIRHVHVQYLKAAHVNNNNFIPPEDDIDSEPEVANI